MPARRLLLVLALCFVAAPALAGADAFTQVDQAYKRTGKIDPCRFSAATLSAALRQETTYATQYFQDFSSAVQTALDARAGGQCQTGATAPGSLAGAHTGGAPPASVTGATSSGIPAPMALLGICAALLALGAAVYAVARFRAWEPLWAADWRHACAEAGFRLSDHWADLTDRRRR